MKTPKLHVLLPVALAILLAAILAVVLLSKPPARRSVQLPDGTVLTLEALTYGEKHQYGGSPSPFSLLREIFPLLPRRPSGSHNTDRPAVVYWLTRRDPKSGAYLDLDWGPAVIVDDHGCTFHDSTERCVSGPGWSASGRPMPKAPAGSQYVLARGTFRSFPRRDRRLKLRLFDRQGKVLAEFTPANPAYQKYPTWTPEALPATRPMGDATVTLVSFNNHSEVRQDEGLQFEALAPVPNFQIAQGGHRTDDWHLKLMRLLDATGNSVSSEPPGLCTHESAWRLHAEFLRRPQAAFAAEEVWAIPRLAIPEPGTVKRLFLSNTVQGVRLALCAIAGPGRVKYSNGVPVQVTPSTGRGGGSTQSISSSRNGLVEITFESNEPHLLVHLDHADPAWKVSLLGQDDTGKEMTASLTTIPHAVLRLAVATNAATLTLKLMVHQTRAVEFLVVPPPPPPEPVWELSPRKKAGLARQLPPRDPAAGSRLIDLTTWFTAPLKGHVFAAGPTPTGSAGRAYDRGELPRGVQRFAGREFDVRGLAQLSGLSLGGQRHDFPKRVEGIAINQPCRRLHFLHGTIWTVAEGTEIGRYIFHYADGQQVERPILYGQDLRDWQRNQQAEPLSANQAALAWPRNPPAEGYSAGLLYLMTWENPRPGVAIRSMDFISTMSSAAPFLVAITAE